MDVVLGFDPGGGAEFGWAVLERSPNAGPRFRAAGVGQNAQDAVRAALATLAPTDRVLAAGIDSPMYWTPTGDRVAEIKVRACMKARGAPNVGGTVQHPNSLRGACVVQGPTVAILLRRAFPDVRITEAHPKALVWALGIASLQRQLHDLTPSDLGRLVACNYDSEHERDAIVSAWTAHVMISGLTGWADLVAAEAAPIFVAGPVEYWFPTATS